MSKIDPIVVQEADWSARIGRGDERAFRELFDVYYAPLCRYAITLMGDADAGEDIVQALFIWIWEHRETWHVRGNLRSYLYRAVHTRVVSRWRAMRVRDAYTERMQADEAIEVSRDGWPDRAAQYAELQAAYWRAVATLPPRGRQAFELHRQHGLSSREIGEVMGISARTVETHIGRALLALRKALVPFLAVVLLVMSR